MDSSRPTVRALTEDELPDFNELLGRSFLQDAPPYWLESSQVFFEPGRLLGAFDADRQIGSTQALSLSMTVPGLRQVPFAAITSVGVAPDHRRRGVLSLLMRTQLHELHETGGECLAALWATESMIYRRFGYGLASQFCSIELPKGAKFRPGVSLCAQGVRELPREPALGHLQEIYDAVAPNRIGWLSRGEPGWYGRLFDDPAGRDGSSALRFAVLDDGYAVYRAKAGWDDRGPHGQVSVVEVVARTPGAYARLWRHLLDLDLAASIEAMVGLDEPLIHLLAEPMSALRTHRPALWVRLVDLDRALAARGYLAPVDVVLDVTDELCPWNAGRWRLRADAGGQAEVTRTDDDADLAMDVLELGGAFLGGTRLSTLAETGLVRELTDGALAATSAAFLGEHLPEAVAVF